MKKELFKDKVPYSNLVIAVRDDIPIITGDEYSFALLQLSRDLLTKDWKKRLMLCQQDKILFDSLRKNKSGDLDSEIDEILKMRIPSQARFEEIENLRRSDREMKARQKDFRERLVGTVDRCFDELRIKGVFTALGKSKSFKLNQGFDPSTTLNQNYLYELTGDLKMGFPCNLFIIITFKNDTNNHAEIALLAIFPSIFLRPNLEKPQELLIKLGQERQGRSHPGATYTIEFLNLFSGIVDFDTSFREHLKSQLIKVIAAALRQAAPFVARKMDWEENMIKSKSFGSINSSSRSIVINSLE
jgi:hypothetical protein